MDHTVTEVTHEVVLSDTAGLHLGAGPVFLLYTSDSTNANHIDARPWPVDCKVISSSYLRIVLFVEAAPLDRHQTGQLRVP